MSLFWHKRGLAQPQKVVLARQTQHPLVIGLPAVTPQEGTDPSVAVVAMLQRQALNGIAQPDLFLRNKTKIFCHRRPSTKTALAKRSQILSRSPQAGRQAVLATLALCFSLEVTAGTKWFWQNEASTGSAKRFCQNEANSIDVTAGRTVLAKRSQIPSTAPTVEHLGNTVMTEIHDMKRSAGECQKFCVWDFCEGEVSF